MVESFYKNSWFQKSQGIWTTSGKQWKVQKSWNSMGNFCPKNTFLELKHIQMIYLTLLWSTCVEIHQILYVIFETISLFHDATLLYFLAQTLHTFYKSNSSKCKFSDFPQLALKFTKFLMLFFKQKVNFSSKFGSLFSVMRDNSSSVVPIVVKSDSMWIFG